MRPRSPLYHRRHGLTLVELLVVITIILALTAVAIPMVRMISREQVTSEAERLVHSYIQTARTRAIETQKATGVLLQRDPKSPNTSILLYQVEVPASYAGDLTGAVVRICNVTMNGVNNPHWPYHTGATAGFPVWKVKIRPQDFLSCVGLLRRGDRMRLNGSGPWCVIVSDPRDTIDGAVGHDFSLDSNGYIKFDLTDLVDTNKDGWVDDNGGWLTLAMDQYVQPGDTSIPMWGGTGSVMSPTWGSPAPIDYSFEIRRQPVPTSAPPLRLPVGTVVDLGCSGTEADPDNPGAYNPVTLPPAFAPANMTDTSPVILLFNTTGELARIYYQNQEHIVTEPVYLLVGTRDRANTPLPDDKLANWQDLTNVWVAINSKTGQAGAAPVAASPGNVDSATKIQRPTGLRESRGLVRQFQMDMKGP